MITIKDITSADKGCWQTLFRAYAGFYNSTVSADAEARVWDWIMDPDNDFWCALALDGSGKSIGFTQFQLMHRSLSGAMVCYMSDLYVEPTVRGSGTGRQLIEHVFHFAKTRGIDNVRWLTQDNNYAGRRLYDSYAGKSDFILYSVPVAVEKD